MEKQRDYSKILMIIYILGVFLTLTIGLLLGLPFLRTAHTWLSIVALIIAETAIYLLALHYDRKRSSGMITGYLAFGMVAVLYFITVLIVILVFSVMLKVSMYTYSLLHFALLAAAGIVTGLIALYFRHSGHQEDHSHAQIQWVRGMQSALRNVKHELESWNDEARGNLGKEIEALEEMVRYSDPMSHPSLLDGEAELLEQVHELSGAVRQLAIEKIDVSGQSERLSHHIRGITNGLANRNQLLIQLK